jgi:hypothetical protein
MTFDGFVDAVFFHVVFCFCRMFLVGGMSHENLDVFFLMFFFMGGFHFIIKWGYPWNIQQQ